MTDRQLERGLGVRREDSRDVGGGKVWSEQEGRKDAG